MVTSRILEGRRGGEGVEDGENLLCEKVGLDNGLEEGVNKSRNPLSDRVMGTDNGAAGVIRFVDFREKIDGGVAGIGDMEKGDIYGGETMDGTNRLKERKEFRVVGFSRVIRENIVTYFFKIHSNIVLPSTLELRKGLFPAGLPGKILKAPLASSILAILPAYLNLLNLITLTILGDRNKLGCS